MATQIATTPDILMLAVQAQVISVTGFPYERVVIDAREPGEADEIPGQAEQVIFLRVGNGRIDFNSVANQGRLCTKETLTISARLWTRLNTDEHNRDDLRITDPSVGHLRVRHAIYDALIDFGPEDSQGNILYSEVMKPVDSTEPRRKKAPTKGWARSVLDFLLYYELALTQNTYP